jgi:enamine deaminase RidA (YjgF/YER057c/UK114 family)
MTHLSHNPSTIAAPTGAYSHGIEVAPDARWLYVTGQVGLDAAGTMATTIEEQCRLAFGNLGEILASAGMTTDDLVRVNAYVIDPRYIEAYAVARDAFLDSGESGGAVPASTVLVVSALADPTMWVEVEAVAASR